MEPTQYTWIPDAMAWGSETTDAEHEIACMRAENWLTENEGPNLSISVRPAHQGEACGIYRGQQILGFSIPVPEEIRELLDEAWDYVLSNWSTI